MPRELNPFRRMTDEEDPDDLFASIDTTAKTTPLAPPAASASASNPFLWLDYAPPQQAAPAEANPWRQGSQSVAPSEPDVPMLSRAASTGSHVSSVSQSDTGAQPKKEGWFASWKTKTTSWIIATCVVLVTPLVLMWILQILHAVVFHDMVRFGIYPRTVIGLRGIIFAPFIHVGWGHLITNTTGWLFLGLPIAMRGVTLFILCTLFIMLVSGVFVWCVGKVAYHVGASGIIFGFFGFVIATACMERPLNWKAILSALVVITVYGGLVFGLVPLFAPSGVSWEYHLGGAIAGVIYAAIFTAWKSHRLRAKKAQATAGPPA